MSKIIVTPLGTISPYLKDSRNCPGFLFECNDQKILLDCGNGITRLLNFPKDLKNLNVFITHYHKDHFGDIGAIQYASYVYHNLGLLDERVKIFLPKNDFGFNKKSIVSNQEAYCEYIDIKSEDTFFVEDFKITVYDNKSHNIESYVIKLQNNSLKMIYTSDVGTINFKDLIDFCRDSDLLICESSFLKKHQASNKHHLTAYDAGNLAKKSCAKKLLLTHLWPEEDKLLYQEEAKKVFKNTEIAEENKKLHFSF